MASATTTKPKICAWCGGDSLPGTICPHPHALQTEGFTIRQSPPPIDQGQNYRYSAINLLLAYRKSHDRTLDSPWCDCLVCVDTRVLLAEIGSHER